MTEVRKINIELWKAEVYHSNEPWFIDSRPAFWDGMSGTIDGPEDEQAFSEMADFLSSTETEDIEFVIRAVILYVDGTIKSKTGIVVPNMSEDSVEDIVKAFFKSLYPKEEKS